MSFTTFFLNHGDFLKVVFLDITTGKVGNMPVFHTKTIESIDTPGLPIGIEPTTEYTQKTISFKKGDIAIEIIAVARKS